LVSFGHCIVSFIDLQLLISPLVSFGHCIVSFIDLQLLISPLVSFGHCIVSFIDLRLQWRTQYNGQKIPKGKSEAVNQWRTQYNGQKIPKGKSEAVNQWRTPFGIFWPLYCVLHWFTASDFSIGILKHSLYKLDSTYHNNPEQIKLDFSLLVPC
jgi:hypothetical protein